VSESLGTVFIVDDDASVRNALSLLIQSIGLNAISCESSEEFLNHEELTMPSCAVVDVRMPGLSGLDLQEAMAARNQSTPIIFITGYGTVSVSVRAMKAGATDFIEKPFDEQVLIDAINAAMAQDRQRRLEESELRQIRARLESLTPREAEVLALVAAGLANKQIAYKLGNSEMTVKVHRGRVMKKMHAKSLAKLLQMAQKVGLDSDG